jgi:AAA+ superfamily predicted ATPase
VSPDTQHDPVMRLTALAAARLMLRRHEPVLEPLAQALLPAPEPQAIAEAAAGLFEELAWLPHPLARIARGCALSAFDLDLLGLALLPCIDDRVAAAVAGLNGAGLRRLPAGLGLRLLIGDAPPPPGARAALWASPLWQHGLLRLPDPLQPAGDRLLDPSTTLLALLDGALPDALPGAAARRIPRPVPVPASLGAAARNVGAWLERPDAMLLHLVGDPARGAALLAACCSAAPEAWPAAPQAERMETASPSPEPHARPLAVFESLPPGHEPAWRDLALIALGIGAAAAIAVPEQADLPGPPEDLAAPVVLLAPASAHVRAAPGACPPARIVLPRPDPLEQAAAWSETGLVGQRTADLLANQTWMTAADIAAVVARAGNAEGIAAARLALAPQRPVRMASLRAPEIPWDRLVLDDTTAARLEDLVRRYRLRVPVRFRWQLDYGPGGLVCLLAGDSGVGKTLAAEAVATRLALPLMRVDLSLVVSKYIGETEKNLSELFAAAEGFAALLFFDEADALFGKRTAVEDAHDRYANVEVNYLLQRLEAFEGIALLATNMVQGVDEAFLRRFDLIVPMPRPGPTQRLQLWRAHLPAGRVDAAIDLAAVADRYELTGGEIRNAALAASYAAADGPGRITPALMHAAINVEFAKKGRPSPSWPAGETR